jgi:hypothetical protein
MFSTAAVFTFCAVSAFLASAFTGVAFLLRELHREQQRRIGAEVQLGEARKQILAESKSAQLDLQRVASDHVALEKERIESRRLARQSPIVVQLHKGGAEEEAA